MKTEKINAYDCLWEYLLVFLKIVKGNEKSANIYSRYSCKHPHRQLFCTFIEVQIHFAVPC